LESKLYTFTIDLLGIFKQQQTIRKTGD